MFKCVSTIFILFTALVVACAAQAETFDPTKPVIFKSKPKPRKSAPKPAPKIDINAYQVSSILISPQRRIAVINGQVVSEGEKIDAAIVKEIQTAAVKLASGKTEFEIRLPSALIDKNQQSATTLDDNATD